MNSINKKKILFLSLSGLLLIGNSIENTLVYMSTLPTTPLVYEASGIQLLYPLTIGLLVYLITWGLNLFILFDNNKLMRHLPGVCILVTCFPVLMHLIGFLPLPQSNFVLYYYGVLIGLILCPISVFLYGKELLCIKRCLK